MRTYAQVFSYRKFLEKYIPSYFLSDYLRICFKFEEEDEKKDTEAMKKERFGAIMGMMQVTSYLISFHLINIFSSNIFEQWKILHHRRCNPLVIHQRNLLERRRGPLPCLRSVLSPNKDLRQSSNAFMKMNTHSQRKCDMFHSLLSDKK